MAQPSTGAGCLRETTSCNQQTRGTAVLKHEHFSTSDCTHVMPNCVHVCPYDLDDVQCVQVHVHHGMAYLHHSIYMYMYITYVTYVCTCISHFSKTVSELGLEAQRSTSKPRVSSAIQRSQSTAKSSSPLPSPSSPSSPPSPHHQPLRLLCNTESIFETLESHQVSTCTYTCVRLHVT